MTTCPVIAEIALVRPAVSDSSNWSGSVTQRTFLEKQIREKNRIPMHMSSEEN